MITNKKGWDLREIDFALKTIKKWFNSQSWECREGTLPHFRSVRHMEDTLGLPYTSSGCAACVSVTNTEVYLDFLKKWRIVAFEMCDDFMDLYGVRHYQVFAICRNDSNDELIIKIHG